ncbi:MAG: energy transducer TonB [Acidobacteria bacterium]|nr:energy transducer TonB [Acidobacteriota bacterium]
MPGEAVHLFASTSRRAGSRRRLAALAALVLAVVAVGAVSFLYSDLSRPAAALSPQGAADPESAAAPGRVRELEARVDELERENAALKAATAGRLGTPSSGELVDVEDPEVVPPILLSEGPSVPSPTAESGDVRVLVEALVDESGRVLETRTLETSVGGRGFEEAAEQRVAGRLYRPATRRGEPVRVRIRVPVEFVP